MLFGGIRVKGPMNIAAQRVAALTDVELERRLCREGVPARIESSPAHSGTPITVTVWGFDAAEMKRSTLRKPQKVNGVKYMEGLWGKTTFPTDHAIWKPAERMAVRSLYLLGLDYGEVDLLIQDQGKLSVTGIRSEMSRTISEEGEQRLQELIRVYTDDKTRESQNGVQAKLGADPEFVLLSADGRLVPASRYFTPDGDAGCDSIRIRGVKRWPLVELRPKPTKDPASLTADVRRLLGVAAQRTAGASLSWRAGALPVPGLPIGGHVHLSGVSLTGERLRALDNAVALPLRLLEPQQAARRRPRYGWLGDVRRQPHGGFEYRTPPSWLVSPRLTMGTFALAKVAAEHAAELAADRPLDDDKHRDAFYQGDRNLLLSAADRIYRVIARTEGYRAYKDAIDFVFDAIARNRSWDETADFREKWRIPVL